MTRPRPTRPSRRPRPAVDTPCSSGHPQPGRPQPLPILLWENAWGTGDRAYEAPEHAELEARDMFQRTLAHWAMDVLKLKAAGLDRPTRPDRTLPALDALPLRPAAAPRRRAA